VTQHLYNQAEFLVSAHKLNQLPADMGREVAFVGRSNVGKSSVINSITNRKGLARISKTPGRTQLINFFKLNGDIRLVDLPGYGFAKVPLSMKAHWLQVMNGYLNTRESLQGLILIIDIRRLLSDGDRQILDWCELSNLPVHILANKADKLSKSASKQAIMKIQAEIKDSKHSVQAFSVLKKQGKEEVIKVLDIWYGLE